VKTKYFAQSAGGFTNSRLSDSPLHFAVDFEADYRDGATWKIWGFFADLREAQCAIARTALPDEAFDHDARTQHLAGVSRVNTPLGDFLVRRGRVVRAFANPNDVSSEAVWRYTLDNLTFSGVDLS
jgi:hypothetical protein